MMGDGCLDYRNSANVRKAILKRREQSLRQEVSCYDKQRKPKREIEIERPIPIDPLSVPNQGRKV